MSKQFLAALFAVTSGLFAVAMAAPKPEPAAEKARRKLSFKEQRELAALPGEIEALEREQTEINARMSSAEYHRQGAATIREDRKRLEDIETLLLEKFARWEALE